MYYKVKYNQISVNYLPELDGGGMTFGQQYLSVIAEKTGRVGHVFEYCAGPGFIGFSLLANGLCDRLTLADVNPAAVKAVETTIRENRLEDRVRVYQSDCLSDIPATEKWDLVVSNPPHWDGTPESYKEAIRLVDPGWIIHKNFYRDVKKFLNPNASIIFQESSHATKRDDFEPMIKENGLDLVEVFEVTPPKGMLTFVAPQWLHKVSRAIAHKTMLPLEKLLMVPGVEKALKDNDLYRKISALPGLAPTQFYFMWSKPQTAMGATVRATNGSTKHMPQPPMDAPRVPPAGMN
jgi:16S rRNA G966 N2-methylase RsmD